MGISLFLTPIVKRISLATGICDEPDHRKIHPEPIQSIGGVAIYLSFVLAILFMSKIDRMFQGILCGGTILVIIGLIDDIRGVNPYVKLIGQILAASVTVAFGINIEFITNPFGGLVFLGILSVPITILWIVGIINAVNLIDGMDGLAAGVSSISAMTLFIVAVITNEWNSALIAIALMGSALGFLRYNFNPAKIFMGDTGSMFLGYMLATASIAGVLKSATTVALAVPILALGIPIYDTGTSIYRRIKQGKHIFTPDNGHLHHRLMMNGLSHKNVVLTIYYANILLGVCALIISLVNGITAIQVLLLIIILIITAIFVLKRFLPLLRDVEKQKQ